MRKSALFLTAASLTVLAGSLALTPAQAAEDAAKAVAMTPVEEGKELAFDRKKGNCLSCHAIAGGELPGNIGPPLVAMKSRFPDKARLRAQIADATVANPGTIMPPFERHKILSKDEVDKIAEFIHTL
jgi:sulfur-oxidizing protein SoxX